MPSNFLNFFPFISFLLDVLAKDWIRSVLVELKYVQDDVVLPVFATLDFFHPSFYLFFFKVHVIVKVFHLHITQVDFYVADSGMSH